MNEFDRGPWSLEWDHQGEGYNGDYDEDDPEDKALLRADLYFKGKMCADGSYCTLAPDDTPEETLKRFSETLFIILEQEHGQDPQLEENQFGEPIFNRRAMEAWTWHTDPHEAETEQ